MKNSIKNNYKLTLKLSLLVVIIIFSVYPKTHASSTIYGQVIDKNNNPIFGASVLLIRNDSTIAGNGTDIEGRFKIKTTYKNIDSIKVHALGYKTIIFNIRDSSFYNIVLQDVLIEVASIDVINTKNDMIETEEITKQQFQQRTKNSIVANNPIQAIKQPQLVKQGSSLSSKLRINGTSPEYYYHNLPIGDNPNHYGMFSVIPASVVNSIKFYPNGTPATYQLPSIIDLEPKIEFKKQNSKKVDFSLVQSTGTYSFGTNDFYTIGTVRKSVLDKLVKHLDVESNRRTIPPTNFEDIVVSSGYKLTSNATLYLDQFYTRDYLEYNTGPTTNNKYGLNTFQHTKTFFAGITYQHTCKTSLLEIKINNRKVNEEYTVTPPQANLQGIDLQMNESINQYNGKIAYTKFYNKVDITSGFEFTNTPTRETYLSQKNWNHTSPDATSNNPFVYQQELNKLYGTYQSNHNDYYNALFTQANYVEKKLKLSLGMRFDKYSKLKDNNNLSYRNRITYTFDNETKLSLFIGTFTESPLKNILENYQVMIRSNQTNLSPLKTSLASLTYQRKSIKLSLFKKRISNIATPQIDFSKVTSENQVTDGFIQILSIGSLHFVGGDISYDRDRFILSKMNLYTYYGYTNAHKISDGNKSLYELNTPHKFLVELNYNQTQNVTFGTEFNFHSGFVYTPYLSENQYFDDNRYQNSYYNRIKSIENSEQFLSYYSLDLFLNYKFGKTDLNFSVSNITNRKNPVILTAEGYIYDPGIMPSIGFNWSL